MQNISSRLKTTIENIEVQRGVVLWDDLEKLQDVLIGIKKLEKQNKTLKARILNLKHNIEIKY
tara:strand:+ start:2190 stop:2378 length:189 start_codon:yes stop_codon:yes gene_type:complete